MIDEAVHGYKKNQPNDWEPFIRLNGTGKLGRLISDVSLKPVISGRTKEGVHWKKSDLDDYLVRFHCFSATEAVLMTIEEMLTANYDAVAEIWKRYKDKLDAFRNVAKNDLASLEAASRKTTEATQRMQKAYSDVIAQMNSREMATAIENAERLAAAMSALASLQSHKLVFSVAEQSK